jgi:hypothetical protein
VLISNLRTSHQPFISHPALTSLNFLHPQKSCAILLGWLLQLLIRATLSTLSTNFLVPLDFISAQAFPAVISEKEILH